MNWRNICGKHNGDASSVFFISVGVKSHVHFVWDKTPSYFYFVSSTIIPDPPSAWDSSGHTASTFFIRRFGAVSACRFYLTLTSLKIKPCSHETSLLCASICLTGSVFCVLLFSTYRKPGRHHLNKAKLLPLKNYPSSAENYNAFWYVL